MDIFNVANKPVFQTAQATANTSVDPKKIVENSSGATSTQQDQTSSKNDVSQKLHHTLKALNDHMESLATNITFGFNDKIHTTFVNVIEKSTGKVIRKIPTEEAMKLSEKMKEIVGIIFDKKG